MTTHLGSPLCSHIMGGIFHILKNYYHWDVAPDFSSFLMDPCPNLGLGGQVALLPEGDELAIGIQFGTELWQTLGPHEVTTHALGVIAEETSHFMLCLEAFENKTPLSLLELETLGEIDRFLVLLHWASWCQGAWPQIKCRWKNIHSLCDHVFTGNRFQEGPNTSLYIEAEGKAFAHLHQAFGDVWDNSHFNSQIIPRRASLYLKELRLSVTGGFQHKSVLCA